MLSACICLVLTTMGPCLFYQDDADQVFMECKEAYETLVDPDSRHEYDQQQSVRRFGFFTDVGEEGEEDGRWPSRSPWEEHRCAQVVLVVGCWGRDGVNDFGGDKRGRGQLV